MTPLGFALRARTFRSLRRHRNYRIFFTGQIVSLAGTWMQNVALAWLVIELSGSPLAIGALAFWRFVPFTVFGLVAGVVADRIESRKLVMATQASAMAISIALAVVTLTGTATLPIVYILAALGGIALAFDAPGRQSLTFQMVGPRELPNAVALNSGLFNGSRIIGPAIAGLVIAAVGTGLCFVVNAVSFLAVLTALALVRNKELRAVEKDPSARIVDGIRRAFAHAWNDPQLRLILAGRHRRLDRRLQLPRARPAPRRRHAARRARRLWAPLASFGLGALVGALAAATFREASWRLFAIGTGAFGVLALLLAPVHNAVLAGVILVGIGVSFTLFTANANALVQLAAPDYLRGRLISIYLLAFVGVAPVGGLFAGWLAEVGGTSLAFAVAGATSLVTILVAHAWRIRAADAVALTRRVARRARGPAPSAAGRDRRRRHRRA